MLFDLVPKNLGNLLVQLNKLDSLTISLISTRSAGKSLCLCLSNKLFIVDCENSALAQLKKTDSTTVSLISAKSALLRSVSALTLLTNCSTTDCVKVALLERMHTLSKEDISPSAAQKLSFSCMWGCSILKITDTEKSYKALSPAL